MRRSKGSTVLLGLLVTAALIVGGISGCDGGDGGNGSDRSGAGKVEPLPTFTPIRRAPPRP